jgi:phosphotransferase system enzyme I (PtsI)
MVRPPKEIVIRGTAASPGVAIGVSFIHEVQERPISRRKVSAAEVDHEVERLRLAVEESKRDVTKIKDAAGRIIGHHLSRIFEAQLLILADEEFLGQVAADIRRSRLNAEHVYNRHIQATLQSLQDADDAYLRGMTEDVRATGGKVLNNLLGPVSRKLKHGSRKLALAENFSPGEVILMDKYKIRGFATMRGGPTSHTALVARSLSIPAVVGVGNLCQRCQDDTHIIIDGDEGLVIINPGEETTRYYRSEQRKRQQAHTRQLRNLAKIPNLTQDGRQVDVLANVDLPSNLDQRLSAGGVEVGLYRTEFFYLAHGRFPSEDDQAEIYRKIAQSFFPHSVTLRVFDLGSDKMGPLHEEIRESNPALGWRGIRFDLDHGDVLRTQVRAILRASEWKNLKIMLPMVSSASEIVRVKRLIRQLMRELGSEDLPFDGSIEVGVMIEIPSAALMAKSLARHIDFFSIGTNDLAQYTLAVDRGNKRISKLYRELHPAVLQLVKATIDAGSAAGRPVSLCGELARNQYAVPLLLGLGLNRFSVTARSVPGVKRLLSRLRYDECLKLANRAMSLTTAERVEALLRSWFTDRFGDIKDEV